MHFEKNTRNSLSMAAAIFAIAGCATTGGGHGQEAHAPHAVHWTYAGEAGPEAWGKLAPDYATCATGQEQSPIDLKAAAAADLPNLAISWGKSKYELTNNGHTIQVAYDAGSTLTLDGKVYKLAQFHFHAPSEHTVEGRAFPAEIHFVHKSDAGELAVVGVLVEKGEENRALATIFDNLPQAADQKATPAGELDASAILPADKTYFSYAGSLTTPPCSEHVRWSVLKTPITASAAQLEKLTALYSANARPVQPLNTRTLQVDSTP